MINDENIVKLWYDDILVCTVVDLFFSDDVYYGTYTIVNDRNCYGTKKRIVEYIEFCIDWHKRIEEFPGEGQDAAEFDSYTDIFKNNQWSVQSTSDKQIIENAPIFMENNQVNWRIKEGLFKT